MKMNCKTKYYITFLFAVLILGSCRKEVVNKKEIVSIKRGVYLWNNNYYDLNNVDSNYSKIYLNLFDVEYNEETHNPQPILYNNTFYKLPKSEIIPTIFISNRIFKELDSTQISKLAENINKKIYFELKQCIKEIDQNDDSYIYGYNNPYYVKTKKLDFRYDSLYGQFIEKINEIQIDCDWTESTKYKYFYLLEQIKKLNKEKIISATLRLYPYKYRTKMGIPPVDKCMLMCYNINSPIELSKKNTIFEYSDAILYLNTDSVYPLPIDFALPCFEQVLIYRENNLIDIALKEVLDYYTKEITHSKKDSTIVEYLVINSNKEEYYYYNHVQCKSGDILKYEKANLIEVLKFVKELKRINNQTNPTVCFFEYNNFFNINKSQIEKIYSSFN